MKNSEKLDLIYNALKMGAVTLAPMLGVTKELLYMIRDDKRDFSKKLAIQLEVLFGIPYTWSRDDKGEFTYDETLAKKTIDDWMSSTIMKSVVVEKAGKDIDNSSRKEYARGIPMYNAKAAGGGVEIYTDPDSAKVVGHLNFPGITKGSFALQVYGSSMHPTLESGDWCVLRPIENKFAIVWGKIYYVEWEEYRVYKRLLESDNPDEVILWSDNQSEILNDKPIHSAISIKKKDIRALCLVTDIYKKSNH